MSELQKKAEKAYSVLQKKREGVLFCDEDNCENYPADETIDGWCDDEDAMEIWLLNHGFPPRRPHVHTVAELAQQIVKGRSLPCLAQWVQQRVEAVTCPNCGKHALFRERRMVCSGCGGIYPADKWAAGEPCGCGCMDARYSGIHSANRLGQLEFQQCQTPGCRWGGDYRRLTVQELADAAQALADE